MISPQTASVLPTTVSHSNTSVVSGTNANYPEASDKPENQSVVSRNLSGKTDYFRKPHGKTRGKSLVGSVEVKMSQKTFICPVADAGGSHAPAVGTSTTDKTDIEQQIEDLRLFNYELAAAAGQQDVQW